MGMGVVWVRMLHIMLRIMRHVLDHVFATTPLINLFLCSYVHPRIFCYTGEADAPKS